MFTPAFRVFPYRGEILNRLLSEHSAAPPDQVERKVQPAIFDEQLRSLGARTIVVEAEYVDRHYLEDFAAYYVRCFGGYRGRCARFHFFSQRFTKRDFCKILDGHKARLSSTDLNEAYLGFIVVRPLPETIVGRTCLRAPQASRSEDAPHVITRSYQANLFGLSFTKLQTLAFQEQDEVVSKCATCALWCIFQGTGKLFRHPMPSAIEITRAASRNFPTERRAIPSTGLDPIQVAQAIRDVGLEPIHVGVGTPDVLKGTAYAYLRAGIPIYMTVDLYGKADGEGPASPFDPHAVAITGYRIEESLRVAPTTEHTDWPLRANRINRLLVHDDQIGPFTPMDFLEDGKKLSTRWRHPKTRQEGVYARPRELLIPVYHKIRIPYGFVRRAVGHFHSFLQWVQQQYPAALPEPCEWDIYLTTTRAFKKDLLEDTRRLPAEDRRNMLQRNLPRFLWRATMRSSGRPVYDLIFDATDVEQGDLFLGPVGLDPKLVRLLKGAAGLGSFAQKYRWEPSWKIIKWFIGRK